MEKPQVLIGVSEKWPFTLLPNQVIFSCQLKIHSPVQEMGWLNSSCCQRPTLYIKTTLEEKQQNLLFRPRLKLTTCISLGLHISLPVYFHKAASGHCIFSLKCQETSCKYCKSRSWRSLSEANILRIFSQFQKQDHPLLFPFSCVFLSTKIHCQDTISVQS